MLDLPSSNHGLDCLRAASHERGGIRLGHPVRLWQPPAHAAVMPAAAPNSNAVRELAECSRLRLRVSVVADVPVLLDNPAVAVVDERPPPERHHVVSDAQPAVPTERVATVAPNDVGHLDTGHPAADLVPLSPGDGPLKSLLLDSDHLAPRPRDSPTGRRRLRQVLTNRHPREVHPRQTAHPLVGPRPTGFSVRERPL